MTLETLIIAGVVAFFGIFAVTLLAVSVWVSLGPRQPAARPASGAVQARRPDVASHA